MSDRKLERRTRVLALQALYAEEQQLRARMEYDSREVTYFSDVLQFSWLDREASLEELFMAKTLVQGVRQNNREIDDFIIDHLENWTIDRLLAIDRTILRLGAYMLEYLLDTPIKVIIDECVELCHRFSSENSYRLVNGVLNTLSKRLRQEVALGYGEIP